MITAASARMFSNLHLQLRALYGVYVSAVLLLFYGVYVKRTMEGVKNEARRVQTFVRVLPLGVVEEEALEGALKGLFVDAEDAEEDEEVVS